MLGSIVGFFGTANRMALFPVRTNSRWRPPPSWKNFKWSKYVSNATGHPIHFTFGSRLWYSGTADLLALFPVRKKSKMAAAAIVEKIQMAISPQPVVRSTSCLGRVWFSGTADLMVLFPPTSCTANLFCLRKQHHITSLLMHKTFGARFRMRG